MQSVELECLLTLRAACSKLMDASSWLKNGIAPRFPGLKSLTQLSRQESLALSLKTTKTYSQYYHIFEISVALSFNGKTGKEQMKSGYRNRMLEKGLNIWCTFAMSNARAYKYRPAVNSSLNLPEQTHYPLKRMTKNLFEEKHIFLPLIKENRIFCSNHCNSPWLG